MNRDKFTSSFSVWMPFVSLPCLITLARMSRTVLNRSGESGHVCFGLNNSSGKLFQSSTVEYVCCGIFIHGFYYVEVISFYS